MINWLLTLTDEQRKISLDEAEQLSGIRAKALEKDWWVTLTLKAIFQSAFSKHIVFKGGTSLSKGWKLISRFSEDIDIALDPSVFGMEYREEPSKSYVSKMKKEGCQFTSSVFKDEIVKQLAALGLPSGSVIIEPAPIPQDHPDTDPQTIFVKYTSLYEPNEYIADEVKIEVGVRSTMIPASPVNIQSLLHEINPRPVYAEVPFSVSAVEPRKTFLEKSFLLHEEFGKPDRTRVRSKSMSRHLYDLHKMMNTPFAQQALSDIELYNHLVLHRERYMRISWVDYGSLDRKRISFLPTADVIDSYRADYAKMQEEMIYEENTPSFEELISSLEALLTRFRE